MLVEHTFVTTLDSSTVIKSAEDFLTDLGYMCEVVSQTHIEMKRGVMRAARAKSILDLPQSVRLEFDRGRITVAASLEIPRKPSSLHSNMLLAVAQCLECILAQGLKPIDAQSPWIEAVNDIATDAKRRKRRSWIIAAILLVFSVSMICLGIILS